MTSRPPTASKGQSNSAEGQQDVGPVGSPPSPRKALCVRKVLTPSGLVLHPPGHAAAKGTKSGLDQISGQDLRPSVERLKATAETRPRTVCPGAFGPTGRLGRESRWWCRVGYPVAALQLSARR